MILISLDKASVLESVDKENKCWIHTVDISFVESIDKNNLIGFKKNERTRNLSNKFFSGNEVFLVTRMDNKYICYGYTIIEEAIKNDVPLYEFYENRFKLKIKRIKYFLQPVVIDDIRNKLESIKSTGRISDVLKVGYYREITQEDYKFIKKQSSTTGMFPVYFDVYTKNMKEFILNTCRSIYNILKVEKNYSQIEITKFLSLLKVSLNGYGINKDVDELKRFYSRYAHELGFKHVTTRDPDKFVVLLSPSGEKNNFGYISLE